jgi:hypothetical protein
VLIDLASEAAGRENVLYRDTDSVHTIGATGGLTPLIGPEYGKLKLEKPKMLAIYHAPKCYTYRDEMGFWQAVFKGIPRSLIRMPDKTDPNFMEKLAMRNLIIQRLHAGEGDSVDYHSSVSLQTYLRTGKLFQVRKRRPTSPDHVYGHIVENGYFRPRLVAA